MIKPRRLRYYLYRDSINYIIKTFKVSAIKLTTKQARVYTRTDKAEGSRANIIIYIYTIRLNLNIILLILTIDYRRLSSSIVYKDTISHFRVFVRYSFLLANLLKLFRRLLY